MNLSLALKHIDPDSSKNGKAREFKIRKEDEAEIRSKLLKVEEYIPSRAAKSARMSALLEKSDKKSLGRGFKIEVKLNLPEKTLVAEGRSRTVLGAAESAEKKLARQINKYKAQHHTDHKMDKRSLAKLKRLLGRG